MTIADDLEALIKRMESTTPTKAEVNAWILELDRIRAATEAEEPMGTYDRVMDRIAGWQAHPPRLRPRRA